MKKMMLLILSSLVVLVAAGCGKKEDYKPVAINEGVDRCEVCNMLIEDDHNATQLILKDGKPLKFDDLGDLFVWTKEHGLDEVGQRFVRDYHSLEWLKLEEAYYVYDKTFQTPMAFGVYSFKDKASAEKFIEEQGKGTLMSASELDSHSWEPNMDMMKGHGHDHEGHGNGQSEGSEESHGSDNSHGDGHKDGLGDSHGDGAEPSHGDSHNNEGAKDEHKEGTEHSDPSDHGEHKEDAVLKKDNEHSEK
ncbi:nitrous oxide reductase accessory protein NosL [Paenibacillus sp. J2TS4]|uniref:nitrous oxide reductase accessory protein NosL n=1 Tax=Paenibacillus sp. J2TS4 TaxID=2807194 RepID=UPI001B051F7E|nr:nitrous oxide reductase accessory protein NosL [Paenibacillus sp. J2TS4]GIP34401.1 hypothetical protein J2TS4_36110 [Paenibacillus sp. J2TS4]